MSLKIHVQSIDYCPRWVHRDVRVRHVTKPKSNVRTYRDGSNSPLTFPFEIRHAGGARWGLSGPRRISTGLQSARGLNARPNKPPGGGGVCETPATPRVIGLVAGVFPGGVFRTCSAIARGKHRDRGPKHTPCGSSLNIFSANSIIQKSMHAPTHSKRQYRSPQTHKKRP